MRNRAVSLRPSRDRAKPEPLDLWGGSRPRSQEDDRRGLGVVVPMVAVVVFPQPQEVKAVVFPPRQEPVWAGPNSRQPIHRLLQWRQSSPVRHREARKKAAFLHAMARCESPSAAGGRPSSRHFALLRLSRVFLVHSVINRAHVLGSLLSEAKEP